MKRARARPGPRVWGLHAAFARQDVTLGQRAGGGADKDPELIEFRGLVTGGIRLERQTKRPISGVVREAREP